MRALLFLRNEIFSASDGLFASKPAPTGISVVHRFFIRRGQCGSGLAREGVGTGNKKPRSKDRSLRQLLQGPCRPRPCRCMRTLLSCRRLRSFQTVTKKPADDHSSAGFFTAGLRLTPGARASAPVAVPASTDKAPSSALRNMHLQGLRSGGSAHAGESARRR